MPVSARAHDWDRANCGPIRRPSKQSGGRAGSDRDCPGDVQRAGIAIRTRRVYNPQQDSLTLIVYHGDQIAATIIAANNGNRVTARIWTAIVTHQLHLSRLT